METAWQRALVDCPLIGNLLQTLFQIFVRNRSVGEEHSDRRRRARRRRRRGGREEGGEERVEGEGGEGGKEEEGGKEGEGGKEEEEGGGGGEGQPGGEHVGDVLNEAGRRGAATRIMSLIEVRFL